MLITTRTLPILSNYHCPLLCLTAESLVSYVRACVYVCVIVTVGVFPSAMLALHLFKLHCIISLTVCILYVLLQAAAAGVSRSQGLGTDGHTLRNTEYCTGYSVPSTLRTCHNNYRSPIRSTKLIGKHEAPLSSPTYRTVVLHVAFITNKTVRK